MNELLEWKLDLDFSDLKSGLNESSSAFKSFKKDSKETKSSLSSVGSELKKTKSVFSSFSSVVKKSLSSISKFIGIGTILAVTMAAITGSIGNAVSRLDTMNNYTNVMANLGISAKDSNVSIKMLSDGLMGLPTALDDAVQSVQRFTSVNENVLASTEMFLSLNNAILAGGAPMDQQRSALEQLSQAYAKGRPDMMEWRSAMSAMPAQLKQVAQAMNFTSADQLGEALRTGKVSMNEFMVTIARLNKEGVNGMLNFADQAKNSTGGVGTSISNMKTAITRGLADVMNAIGRSNIAGFFNGITKAINIATSYIVAFVNVFKSLLGFQTDTSKTTEAIVASGKNLGSIGSSMSDGFDEATGSAKKTKKEIEKLGQLAGIDNLNILDDGKSNSPSDTGNVGPSVGAVGGLGDLGSVVPEIDMTGISKATEIAEKFKVKWLEVKDKIIENKVPIISTLAAIGTGISLALVIPKMAGFATLISNFGALKAIGAQLAYTFSPLITALSSISIPILAIVGVVMAVVGAVAQLWQTNEEFRASITNAWNGIKDTLSKIWETTLKPVLISIKDMFTNIWELGIKPLWDGWTEFVRSIIMAMTTLWDEGLKPVVDFLIEKFGPIFASTFDNLSRNISFAMSFIGTTIGAVLKNISIYIDGLVGVFSGVIAFLTGVFTGDWSKAWEGVKKIFSSIVGTFKGIFQNVWNYIIGIFNAGGKIFDGIVGGIADVFKTIVNGIISGINRIIRVPFDSINGILNTIRGIGILGIKPFKGVWSHDPLPVPQIPKFADGGIAYGRTIGEFAEYANARSNPEVIAPLDKLKNIIGETQNSAEQAALLREQNRLLKKLVDKDNDVNLDGKKVNKRLARQKLRESRMKGYAVA